MLGIFGALVSFSIYQRKIQEEKEIALKSKRKRDNRNSIGYNKGE